MCLPTAVEVQYRPLNRHLQRRSVVWQPTSKRTGEDRGYWLHRAVGLRYNLLDGERWCLSIRPELRATKDGLAELPPEEVGRKVTRETARRFNYDLLAEVNFWRDFLSGSGPHIILPFGSPATTKQRVVMSTTLMHGEVSWPGIPEEDAKPYKNVDYLDDLFSWAEFNQPNAGRDGTDEWDPVEEDDKDGY